MATVVETSPAHVDAAESEAKVDLNLDEAVKAAKLAALKGDSDEVKDEAQQPIEGTNDSHSNGAANGDAGKEGHQNGNGATEHVSPNKGAASEHAGEGKKDDACSESDEVPSSEAAQDATESSEAKDQAEGDAKANDADSAKGSVEGSADQQEAAAPSE